ncbi:MAG: ribosomal RNA small subunit methyltransferase A [Firmicutes bacterium]|nr:ribosomal RNA small subunit methyltransferase A [Bacillota bacterium]
MKAKKSLGQNFLINDTIINQIVSLFCVSKNDLIVEIGPGRGALTQKLVNSGADLLCIEIDKDMQPILSKYENDKCHIIYEDILQVDIKNVIKQYNYENLYIIGNLPYYITSPILEYLIKSNINANKMVFMVQKEVADRFSAKVCSKSYGYMTLFLDFYYQVTSEIFVPRSDFNPTPKVDSAVIKLVKKQKNYNVDPNRYFAFLKEAFRLKRKTLKNNLAAYNWDVIKIILNDNGLKENVRAEELSQDIFIKIFNALN